MKKNKKPVKIPCIDFDAMIYDNEKESMERQRKYIKEMMEYVYSKLEPEIKRKTRNYILKIGLPVSFILIVCFSVVFYNIGRANKVTTLYPLSVAEENSIVYVTSSGHKYHKENCDSLLHSKHEITLKKALEEGYSACSLCNP